MTNWTFEANIAADTVFVFPGVLARGRTDLLNLPAPEFPYVFKG